MSTFQYANIGLFNYAWEHFPCVQTHISKHIDFQTNAPHSYQLRLSDIYIYIYIYIHVYYPICSLLAPNQLRAEKISLCDVLWRSERGAAPGGSGGGTPSNLREM